LKYFAANGAKRKNVLQLPCLFFSTHFIEKLQHEAKTRLAFLVFCINFHFSPSSAKKKFCCNIKVTTLNYKI